ncbi:MAG: hypothetical protein ABI624_15670 [Casimicrobiaceae bacterium]
MATICAVAQPVATPAAPPVTVPAPTPLVTTQVPTTLPTALLPVVVQGFECRSDDPGWRLDANRTSAQFDLTTSKGRREVVFRGALQPLTQTPQLVVWRGDSTHLPRETLVVTVREEACRGTATHRAVLSVKAGEAMMGCCTMRAGYDARVAPAAVFAAKGPADWARLLPDLLPAINLCVAREGGRARWISRAAPTAQGMAVVRVVETSGAVVDCTADLAGRGTPKVDPVRATDPPPANAGNPLFYPPREPPPMVSCGKLERVVTKSGALSGYLHYDPC